MPLAQEPLSFRFVPRGADAAGRVTINERVVPTSFIVSSDQLVEPWPPRRIAELQAADLEPVLALQPTVILLGSGIRHAFPAPAVLAAALTRGIGIEVMDNAAAARTFTVLASEGRRVVAAFLVDAD